MWRVSAVENHTHSPSPRISRAESQKRPTSYFRKAAKGAPARNPRIPRQICEEDDQRGTRVSCSGSRMSDDIAVSRHPIEFIYVLWKHLVIKMWRLLTSRDCFIWCERHIAQTTKNELTKGAKNAGRCAFVLREHLDIEIDGSTTVANSTRMIQGVKGSNDLTQKTIMS